jgi:hypothetical protein
MRRFAHEVTAHVFIGFVAFIFSYQAKAKEFTPNGTSTNKLSWNANRKLSWADFKGPVSIAHGEEAAAATCCSIGFRLGTNESGAPEVFVYNTFYIDRSWVKEDARIASILTHEQGHFDLCELYTRILRQRLNSVDLRAANVKQMLMTIYSAVNDEYEARQQAYEQETAHGTIIPEQQRWDMAISAQLSLII